MKIRIRCAWLLLGLLASGPALAVPYTSVRGPDSNVDDLWFYQAPPVIIEVNGYSLRYQVHYLPEVLERTPYHAGFVHDVVVDASGQSALISRKRCWLLPCSRATDKFSN